MFGKRHLRSSDQRHRSAAPQPAALFARYERKLRARVRSIVSTSEANVEDACMYAWLMLLRHELDEVAEPYSWLTTIAVREAVKLERAERRTRPLVLDEYGAQARPGEELAAHDLLAHAAAIIQEAGLTARQLQMISLQLWGLSYEQIAVHTGDSRRTVERQILRARSKLAEALQTSGG